MEIPKEDLAQQLAAGLTEMGLSVPAAAQAKLLDYVSLLAKWNRAYNLTAVREPSAMLTRHILDSLAIAPSLTGQRILDVGSGPGLPGIPLALYYPDKQFVLLDSLGKKTRFMQHVVQELQLLNVEVVQTRVENHQPAQCFDNIVTRAFSQVANVLQLTQHLCCPGGTYLLMKGVHPEKELENLPSQMQLEQVKHLSIPGLDAMRCLVIIKRE